MRRILIALAMVACAAGAVPEDVAAQLARLAPDATVGEPRLLVLQGPDGKPVSELAERLGSAASALPRTMGAAPLFRGPRQVAWAQWIEVTAQDHRWLQVVVTARSTSMVVAASLSSPGHVTGAPELAFANAIKGLTAADCYWHDYYDAVDTAAVEDRFGRVGRAVTDARAGVWLDGLRIVLVAQDTLGERRHDEELRRARAAIAAAREGLIAVPPAAK